MYKQNKAGLFGEKAVSYFTRLPASPSLPSSITLMNPYQTSEAGAAVEAFFNKFYSDTEKRIFILGINPGRFGGGITGIPFTDPVALEEYCGIKNNFNKKRELSSTFIYLLISRMGGTEKFFGRYYLSALFPFALVRNGNNINYYDSPELFGSLKEYISVNLNSQVSFGAKHTVISLGRKNAVFLERINSELGLFKEVKIFEHPRYIMQYRRKHMDEYLKDFCGILEAI